MAIAYLDGPSDDIDSPAMRYDEKDLRMNELASSWYVSILSVKARIKS